MSLRIVYDFANRIPIRKGDVVLNSIPEWVQHSGVLEQAARSPGSTINVLVHHPSLEGLMQGYAGCYPNNVAEESTDSRAMLAKREGSIPDDLDEELIQFGALLDHARPPELPIEDWVLDRLFGIELFGQMALNPADEVRLLCALCKAPSLLGKQFVLRHVQSTLGKWQRSGGTVLDYLHRHGPTAAPAILVGCLLARYPDGVLHRALLDRDLIPAAPSEPLPDCTALPAPSVTDLPPSLTNQLETLVHSVLKSLPISRYLSCISGTLAVELDVLTERIINTVDAIPISDIRSAFKPLVDAGRAGRIREIESLWAVERPLSFPAPEDSAIESWHRVVSFFEDYYLPAWQATHSTQDAGLKERLIHVDEQYTEWLMRSFFDLSLGPDSPLADRVMQRRIRKYLHDGITVVWLIVDGGSWNLLVDMLGPTVRNLGAHVSDIEPSLAALPTITDVGMLSLVSLSPLDAIYDPTEHSLWKRLSSQSRKDREATFRSQFPDGVYQFVRHRNDVSEAFSQEAAIYCFIYGEVDALLHKNSDYNLFQKYQESALADLMQWIFSSLEYLKNTHGESHNIRILVTSDHGWTDLYHNESVHIPHYLTEDELTEASHNRLLILCRDDLDEQLRESLKPEWHILTGTRFRLPPQLTFLLPRRLAPLATTSARLHGGASMLETIVPVVEITVAQPHWSPVIARLDAYNLIADHLTETSLTIKNPNDVAIPSAVVRIPSLQVWEEVGPIPEGSTVAFTLTVRALMSGSYSIQGSIEYEVPSVKNSDSFTATIAVQPSEQERMSGKNRADELFNELEGGHS